MTQKEQILAFLDTLEDEEVTTEEVTNDNEDIPSGDGVSEGEENIPAEVNAPSEAIADDVTTVTNADDLIEETLDMRFSSFQQKQDELEKALKLLLGEIQEIKQNLTIIENGTDLTVPNSNNIQSLNHLINLI